MGQLTEAKAFENLKSIMSSISDLKLRIPVSSITLEHVLRKDLGFDSIVLFSVLMELEASYPHITEEIASKWLTIDDCVKSMVNE
ncbi:MAG: phosphopantetheine-binding protein [Bdellovibrionota bacterium]